MNKTVVLFSGGLDSTTVLAQCLHQGDEVYALSIDYNQSNRQELERCKQIAACWGFPCKLINVHLERTDARAEIPARNTIFLAKALEHALLIGANQIAYGAEPDATYTDSSPEYIKAMDTLMSLHGVRLIAPIRHLNGKAAVLRLALDLGVPLDLVHSSRTDRVDGGDKASARFLKTLYAQFPGINPVKLLQDLAKAHHYSNRNPFFLTTEETGSFKYFPALLLLSSLGKPEPDAENGTLKVWSTGNWGGSLRYVNQYVPRYDAIDVVLVPHHAVDQLQKNTLNTNMLAAVWGTKQALSRLPRPRYFNGSLDCRVTQGHLRKAITDLGWKVDKGGIPLITESRA